MPIQMFNWVSRPDPKFQVNAAAAGAILLGMTLLMNGVAIYVRYRFRKRITGEHLAARVHDQRVPRTAGSGNARVRKQAHDAEPSIDDDARPCCRRGEHRHQGALENSLSTTARSRR
jgi:hypothetical protein